jgi:hypothetical protein
MSNCSICLGNTTEPFTSKCQHTFCNSCILEWITQNDECPLCRNPISETPTRINSDEDEENDNEPIYIIYINDKTIFEDEYDEINDRIDDFIETLDEPMSIYQWRASKDGSNHTMIRKKKYYMDLKLDLVHIKGSNLLNYYKIYVEIKKRSFIEPKQFKHRNKYFKLNKLRNAAYLCK